MLDGSGQPLAHLAHPAERIDRPCRRSGSRRRRRARSGRSDRTGPARRWRRNRASTTTRPRRGWPPRASRSRSRADSAGSPRPDRPTPTPSARNAAAAAATSRRSSRWLSRRWRPALVPEDQRVAVAVVAQQIFREVEPGAGEPARPQLRIGRRHPVEPDHDASHGAPTVVLVGDHPAKTPDLGPERVGPSDRPGVEAGEILHGVRSGGRPRRTSARNRVMFARATRSGEGVQIGSFSEASPDIRSESVRGVGGSPSARTRGSRRRRIELRVLRVEPGLVVVRDPRSPARPWPP